MNNGDIQKKALEILVNRYTGDELRTLMFDIGWDSGSIVSTYQNKSTAALEMVTYASRHGQMVGLIRGIGKRSDLTAEANLLLDELGLYPVSATVPAPRRESLVPSDELRSISDELANIADRITTLRLRLDSVIR